MSSQRIKMLVPLVGISQGARSVTYETDGFVGETCKTATEAFEKALGTVTDDTLKEEYYQTEERKEYLREGGDQGG